MRGLRMNGWHGHLGREITGGTLVPRFTPSPAAVMAWISEVAQRRIEL
jgi:hypothetical protein